MARQVLPIVGAVVGAFFGAPQLGYAIGAIIGNAVDPLVIEGPKIGETPMQTSAEGVTRPIVYGTAPVMGNVIAAGNKVIKKKKERQGKGGPVTVTERLYQTFAVRICEGPIVTIPRIWEDEKLVMDARPGSPIPQESAEFLGRLRIYIGDESQMPDPDLEVKYGAGNTPAYRGTCYAVFPMADLTDRRGSFPNYRWEVATAGGASDATALAIYNKISDWYEADSASTIIGQHAGTSLTLRTRGAGPFNQSLITSPLDTAVTFTGRTGDAASSGFASDFGQTPEGTKTANPTAAMHAIFRIANDVSATGSRNLIGGMVSPANFDNDDGFRLTIDVTGPTSISVRTPQNNAISGLTSDQWHMVAVERQNTGGGTYSDRHRVDDGGWTSDAGGVTDFDDVGFSHSISGRMTNDDINFLYGLPDGVDVEQVVIFNNTLTDSEWDWLYNEGNYRTYEDVKNAAGMGTVVVGAPVPLHSIVSDIHERCGHTSDQYDVTELTDEVSGIVLAGDYTGAAAIRSFMPAYFFDAGDYDKAVRYHKRGKPVVRTLTINDLVDAPEEATRENAIEYPKKINLAYQNPVVGYAPAKATTTRSSPDVRVVGERNLQIPVCMEADQAAQVSDKLMKVAWAEADGDVKFTISDKDIDLVPTDCIGLSLRGTVRRLRIDKIEFDPGTLRLTCRNDRQSAYTSNVTGVPVPIPTPPPPSIAGATVFAYLDIPALIDTNDTLNYYVAASGINEAWFGAMIQRKLEGASNFDDVTVFSSGTVMGVLLNDISDASEHYTDTTNVVRVSLYDDEVLESISQQQFLSEGGAFALEKPDGTWEVMQYRDAEDDSNGDWTLSPLLRGRLNSGTSAHSAGARFVLLDGVRIVAAQSAWLGTDLTHRAVSFNTSPETAVEYVNEYTGQSQVEWPCADLLFSLSGDELTATAIPRHRFGTEDAPVRSINWVGYHFHATDGVNTANREQTSEAAVFNVLGWSIPITVTVWQVNRITGRGQPYTEQYE